MSELDTREQLEKDVYRAADEMEEFTHGEKCINTNKILRWLDRQAAITERECCEKWPGRANVDKLERRLKLAEEQRDRESAGCREYIHKLAELTAERDELQAAIDAMGNGQMYAMYAAMRIERNDLRAEVDELNKHNANQADTIRRLRAEFEAALDDLVRAVEDKRSHPF